MIVGGYSLHLYCDQPGCQTNSTGFGVKPSEFAGWCRRDAEKQARADGWSFNHKRPEQVKCPNCAKGST